MAPDGKTSAPMLASQLIECPSLHAMLSVEVCVRRQRDVRLVGPTHAPVPKYDPCGRRKKDGSAMCAHGAAIRAAFEAQSALPDAPQPAPVPLVQLHIENRQKEAVRTSAEHASNGRRISAGMQRWWAKQKKAAGAARQCAHAGCERTLTAASAAAGWSLCSVHRRQQALRDLAAMRQQGQPR